MVEIRRAAPKIGAEIVGVDVRNLDDATFNDIYNAFLDHIVIVVRGQQLEPADFLGFAGRFGPLKPHLVKKSHHAQYPELMVMDNRIVDVKKNVEEANALPLLVKLGAVWHTDLSYEYVTAKATGMHALAVPSTGGDTPFANMYKAYETLSEPLRKKIDGLSASYKYGGRGKRQLERLEDTDRDRAPAVHPLVQVHPETGRKMLYFNGGQVIDIVGVDAQESDSIIEQLKAHTESVDGDYRHKWQAGDVVIWDNRCSLHTATGDYPVNERRTMWRTTIMGEGWQRDARTA
jgi:taurine dioxygenase